jgi:hypothetical protein
VQTPSPSMGEGKGEARRGLQRPSLPPHPNLPPPGGKGQYLTGALGLSKTRLGRATALPGTAPHRRRGYP